MTPSASTSPLVTIVTAARSAAATIGRCCNSVLQQKGANWEHVIVTRHDDAPTRDAAVRAAGHDRRVIQVRADADSAAAARNAGLQFARGEFVLFLDADDTIHPRQIATLLRAAVQSKGDIVVSGHRLMTPSGLILTRHDARHPRDLDEGTIAVLHAMLFRRSIVDAIGGFDPALRTSEDWDLCLRARSAGARFTVSAARGANYWTSPGSLCANGAQMLIDRTRVLQRVAAAGGDSGALAPGIIRMALWAGAKAVAYGHDLAPLLAALRAAPPMPPVTMDRNEAACALLDGLMLGFLCPYRQVEAHMEGKWQVLAAFLGEVGEITGDEGLEHVALGALEAELARIGPARARVIGETRVTTQLFTPIPAAPARQIVLRLPLVRPRSLGRHVFAPQVAEGRRGIDLMARRLADWLMARPRNADHLANKLRDTALRALAFGLRHVRPMPARAAPDEPQEGADWEAVFATEDPWNYHNAYEQGKYARTLGLLGNRRFDRALELACAEGLFTVQLAAQVDNLTAADISRTALERARARCEDAGLANIRFEEIDFFNANFGTGWDLIVASEVLYYMGSPETVARFAARVADALCDGGLFLHAHAYEVSDSPDRTGFDWGDSFAAATISAAFRANPDLVLDRAIESELYRIELYRKAPRPCTIPAPTQSVSVRHELGPELAADVVWNGALVSRAAAEAERCTRLPVLLYHSVAEDGPAGLAPWRVTPEQFEHQLRFLRRRGYRPVSLAEWEDARRRSAALSGRPVLITFDDGLADFADTAWPLLQRNGFGAELFVVSGAAGGSAQWDAHYGAPTPLMDWDCLADLAAQGIGIGSHLHRHAALDRLDAATLLTEARRSREVIEDRLGISPLAVAPPYGICTRAHGELLARAGFGRVFLASGGRAPVWGPRLATPRIEIGGEMTIEDFAHAIGAIEPPEAADLP